jgi:hypothetical protein
LKLVIWCFVEYKLAIDQGIEMVTFQIFSWKWKVQSLNEPVVIFAIDKVMDFFAVLITTAVEEISITIRLLTDVIAMQVSLGFKGGRISQIALTLVS